MRVALLACISILAATLAPAGCSPTLRGTACAADDQCAVGEACLDQVCRPVACLADSDCDAGTCHPEAFVCVGQPCDADEDCDPGAICPQGSCAAGCYGDEDCLEEWRCEPDTGPYGTCV